jgi:IS5 family transposase
MYSNQGPAGGRPNIDPVIMVKLLVLQACYGLSDLVLERQTLNRIDFMHFLGFPETLPDYATVWQFRESLAESGKDREVWANLQRQLDMKGLKVKKGVVQDASFITVDPGHAVAEEPRGGEAQTRRSRDGSWTKKGNRSYFGYKLHWKVDVDHGLIRGLEATTASVHDSRVDFPGGGVCRGKGYQGAVPCGWDGSMRRGARDHPLWIWGSSGVGGSTGGGLPGGPFAVIKGMFNACHVLVSSLPRVKVKMVFACLCCNLLQLRTLGGGLTA